MENAKEKPVERTSQSRKANDFFSLVFFFWFYDYLFPRTIIGRMAKKKS